MADAVRIGSVSDLASPSRHGPQHAHGHRHRGLSFQDMLNKAFNAQAATAPLRIGHPRPGVHKAAAHVTAPPATAGASTPTADAALTQAMALENVPASWQPALHFIMTRESGGQVGIRNPVHSARGLFQLTAAHYHLNPRGAASFGNAVEEAQGGIRYIRQRYGSAEAAVAHWQRHHWY
jgi:hypothetical protein